MKNEGLKLSEIYDSRMNQMGSVAAVDVHNYLDYRFI